MEGIQAYFHLYLLSSEVRHRFISFGLSRLPKEFGSSRGRYSK